MDGQLLKLRRINDVITTTTKVVEIMETVEVEIMVGAITRRGRIRVPIIIMGIIITTTTMVGIIITIMIITIIMAIEVIGIDVVIVTDVVDRRIIRIITIIITNSSISSTKTMARIKVITTRVITTATTEITTNSNNQTRRK